METVHENLQFYPPTGPSRPPISDLDRFLTGQTHSLQLQAQSNDHKEVQMGSGFAELSSPIGGIGDELYGLLMSNPCLLPGLHSDQDYSGLFCDDQDFHGCIISTNTHEMMSESYNNVQVQPKNGGSSETKTSGRGRRSSSATSLGKRKWTEDEDRTLVKLVKQYGVKKWACIAQRLEGRTAKQCRERWQNHLRPDIKKDSWSEEEEKIFIEAHEKLGNRWSEIARRIPGRTENAVKNHWNATKRRRNQVRGSKNKGSDQNLPKPSSLLQDYMKRNNFYGVLSAPHNKSSQHTNNVGSEMISTANEHHHTATPISKVSTLTTPLEAWEYEYSSPMMTDTTCDEEVMFMLNLFSSSHKADHQPLGLQPPPMASWGGGYGDEPGDHLRHCHDHHYSSIDNSYEYRDQQATFGCNYNGDYEIGESNKDGFIFRLD